MKTLLARLRDWLHTSNPELRRRRRQKQRARFLELLEHRRVLAGGDLLLTIPNPSPTHGERFGYSLALQEGQVLAGAGQGDGEGHGTAELIDVATGQLSRTLTAANPQFGYPVALTGDYAIVADTSVVRVFDKHDGSLIRTIQNPEPQHSLFGGSLATAGNLLAAGVLRYGSGMSSGAAHLFNVVTGERLHSFHHPTPSTGASDFFGTAVAVSANYVAVLADQDQSASGSARIYIYSTGTGELVSTFTDPTPVGGGGGYSTLTMWGDNVVVGLPHDESGGSVFVIESATGNLLRTFKAQAPNHNGFGRDVEVSGDTLVVGTGQQYSGLGGVEVFDLASGAFIRAIESPAPMQGDNFGNYLDLDETHLVVSASDRTGGGTVYVFDADWPDPPVIQLDATISYREGQPPQLLASGAVLTDSDSQNYDGGRLTISIVENGEISDQLYPGGEGNGPGQILHEPDGRIFYGGVQIGVKRSGGGNGNPLSFEFNENATPEAVQALIRVIRYRANSNDPSPATRTVHFVLQEASGVSSLPGVVRVRVTPLSNPPAVAFSSDATYVENGPPVLLDPEATISDSDSPTFDTGTISVTITEGTEAEDRLTLLSEGFDAGEVGVDGNQVFFGGQVIGTFNEGIADQPLTLRFTAGSVTPAIAQHVLRRVGYHSTSDAFERTTRSLSLRVTDGDGGVTTVDAGVLSIVNVPEPPVILVDSAPRVYVEDTRPIALAPTAVLKPGETGDVAGGTLTVRIENPTRQEWLRIRHRGTEPGKLGVHGDLLTFGGVLIGSFTVGRPGQPLVVSLNDAATLPAVQAILRSVTFAAYGEDPVAGFREVSLVFNDGDGGVSEPAIVQVRVDPVVDRPVLSIKAFKNYTLNSEPLLIGLGAAVSDRDSPHFDEGSLRLEWLVNSDDTEQITLGDEFAVEGNQVIDLASGRTIATIASDGLAGRALLLEFNANARVAVVQELVESLRLATVGSESYATRTLGITLDDGEGGRTTLTRSLNVRAAVNEVPSLSEGGVVNYVPGSGPQRIHPAALVTDADSPDLFRGELRVEITANAQAGDTLAIASPGDPIEVVLGTVRYNSRIIGTWSGGTEGTPLVVKFTEAATLEAVQALVQHLTFDNSTDGLGTASRTIAMTLTDGDGGRDTAESTVVVQSG